MQEKAKQIVVDFFNSHVDVTTILGRKPTVFNRGMNATCRQNLENCLQV